MNKKFPSLIPIFPLSGVIYFPKTNLPLNIFEERYVNLINDVTKKDNLMGMIQSTKKENKVYKVGCLGRINDHQKSEDGRILINLTGIIRFEIIKEVKSAKLYREFKVDYKKFTLDTEPIVEKINTISLMDKTKKFFQKSGLLLNWKEFEKLDEVQKINTLAMIAPISNEEKQTILESIHIESKTKALSNIIDFYLHGNSLNNPTLQ